MKKEWCRICGEEATTKAGERPACQRCGEAYKREQQAIEDGWRLLGNLYHKAKKGTQTGTTAVLLGLTLAQTSAAAILCGSTNVMEPTQCVYVDLDEPQYGTYDCEEWDTNQNGDWDLWDNEILNQAPCNEETYRDQTPVWDDYFGWWTVQPGEPPPPPPVCDTELECLQILTSTVTAWNNEGLPGPRADIGAPGLMIIGMVMGAAFIAGAKST